VLNAYVSLIYFLDYEQSDECIDFTTGYYFFVDEYLQYQLSIKCFDFYKWGWFLYQTVYSVYFEELKLKNSQPLFV